MQINSKNQFITQDFLLHNSIAKTLYHDYASKMPIIDYHNHLSAEIIAKNIPFKDITEAWLSGDHYKWRAMRANGIDEKYITGNASSKEKFEKWAETVPHTIKNPLFHWVHLELQRYFDIDDILQPDTSEKVFNDSTKILKTTSPKDLLLKMNVEVVCTTDDPTDDLRWHKQIASSTSDLKVLPTFRSDAVLDINSPEFQEYITKLTAVADTEICDINSLLIALRKRIDYFGSVGCKLSDYGLTGPLNFVEYTYKEADIAFKKRLDNQVLSEIELKNYRSYVLVELAKVYHKKNWVQQYHLGAIRNNNSRLQEQFGADAGCDSIGDYSFVSELSRFLDRLDSQKKLAKTIVYNLNPSENETFATMLGNFNTGEVPGKMQWGAAWWFLDQKDGIEKQINTLSNMGLLSRFVGMLTDSRSFLSFPRHEYFRRVVCNIIGKDIESGELPNDIHFFGKIVERICYHNAKEYFEF